MDSAVQQYVWDQQVAQMKYKMSKLSKDNLTKNVDMTVHTRQSKAAALFKMQVQKEKVHCLQVEQKYHEFQQRKTEDTERRLVMEARLEHEHNHNSHQQLEEESQEKQHNARLRLLFKRKLWRKLELATPKRNWIDDLADYTHPQVARAQARITSRFKTPTPVCLVHTCLK